MKEIHEIICTVALAIMCGAAISLAFVLDEERKDRAIPERDLTELRLEREWELANMKEGK
jgi:hypothetical protein